MDRYLCRAKRIDNGEWVIGCLRQGKHVKPAILDECFIFEVDPSTIGQCTGLKDKNGKLIFEGDILKVRVDDVDKPLILDIKWCNGFYINLDIEFGLKSYIQHIETKNIEIIGNIHENSDLIV